MDQRNSGLSLWVYPIVLVLSLVILGVGIYVAATQHIWAFLGVGCACVVATLIAWPIAAGIAESRSASQQVAQAALVPIAERLEQFSVMLNLISENQLLSDRAKGVAFREKDREALRRAIQEEIAKQDYEAAYLLANLIETEFGYKQEADRFKTQIAEKQNEIARRQIMEGIAVIDRLTRVEKWQEAHREAERLITILPSNEQVRGLPSEIELRLQQHKVALLNSWNDAVARKDTDGSIEILKKLDPYLSTTEAEAMQETARTVFKQKMENLRTQFSVAVQDHRWQDSIRIGDAIMRDFPNTQMAKEVRDMMDVLRQRATQPEPAAV